MTTESPDTKTLRLKWSPGYHVKFATGQFIAVSWPDTPEYKRAYSLSSCALDAGAFEITVKRDGKMGTRIVDWAEAGNTVVVIQPTGRFLPVFDPPGKHPICVAGGCGVAPCRGCVRELEKENSQFRFLATCTRLADDGPWAGRRGRIDADWISAQINNLGDTVFTPAVQTRSWKRPDQKIGARRNVRPEGSNDDREMGLIRETSR